MSTTETVVPNTISPEAAPHKSSGYRRLQTRHKDLITAHEALIGDYESLRRELKDQKAEYEDLRSMYVALQEDVVRVLGENEKLIDAINNRPAGPVRYGDPRPSNYDPSSTPGSSGTVRLFGLSNR